jgi:hypothetical protein
MPKHPRHRGTRQKARRRADAARQLLADASPRVPPSPHRETARQWLERLLASTEAAHGGGPKEGGDRA